MWKTIFKKFPFDFFKGCLPQILLGPFLNTLIHLPVWLRPLPHSFLDFNQNIYKKKICLIFVRVTFCCFQQLYESILSAWSIFRTVSTIYNGVFFIKIVNGLGIITPINGLWVLITPLNTIWKFFAPSFFHCIESGNPEISQYFRAPSEMLRWYCLK